MSIQSIDPPLILASTSATRRRLMRAAGLSFETSAPNVDEGEVKRSVQGEGGSPEEAALILAELKAQRVARLRPDALVIGANQVLVCGDRWFDKPATPAAARAHLEALRGREHRLATAVVCQRGGQRVWHAQAAPRLRMRDISDAFLELYLAAEGESLTETVGGYRLEGLGAQLFDEVEGEHAAILGLPLLSLLGFLRQHGVLLS